MERNPTFLQAPRSTLSSTSESLHSKILRSLMARPDKLLLSLTLNPRLAGDNPATAR